MNLVVLAVTEEQSVFERGLSVLDRVISVSLSCLYLSTECGEGEFAGKSHMEA